MSGDQSGSSSTTATGGGESESIQVPAGGFSLAEAAGLFSGMFDEADPDRRNDGEEGKSQDDPVDDPAEHDVPEDEIDGDGEDPDKKTGQPDDDAEEVEYEGAKYRIPKPLKDAFLRQQDYTQKTMALADERRAFEARERQSKEVVEDANRYVRHYAEIERLNGRLAELQGINWDWLRANDPQQYAVLATDIQAIASRKDQLAGEIRQMREKALEQELADFEDEVRKSIPKLRQLIPGINDKVLADMKAYGMAQGYADAELALVTDPRAFAILHKAMSYDKLMAEKTAAAAKKVQPVPGKPMSPGAAKETDQQVSTTKKVVQRAKRTGRTEDAAAAIGLLLGKR